MKRLTMLIVAGLLLLPAAAWAADDYPYPSAPSCCANSCTADPWSFYYRECTSFVAWRMNHNNDVGFTNGMDGGHWGNAGSWYLNAPTVHYVVNNTPVPGCIAEFNYGHVAWVSSVNPNGTVNVEEYNYNLDCNYGTRQNVTATHYIHAYHSHYVANNSAPFVKPGGVVNLQAQYQNDAREYWVESTDLSDRHSVELWSCNAVGDPANSWLQQVNWIGGSQQRVKSFDGAPGSKKLRTQTATFTFQGQVPSNAPTGDVRVWFRPMHGGLKMDEWGAGGGGLNFLIQVDADPPTPFVASVAPGTNNVNSFSFSWTASSDNRSLLKGYYWSVNGGSETFVPPATLSVPAGAWATQQGTNTFNVRAEDNAGNSTSAPAASFTLNASPCPGREISHSPCRQPGDPCLPATAQNLQTLPDATSAQWASVGQPVRGLLQPGKRYSIGFEYRSSVATEIKLGVGTFNPSSNLGLVLSQSTLPVSSDDWKTFWSAPFSLTAQEAQKYSSLRFVSSKTDDGLEIRGARILSVP